MTSLQRVRTFFESFMMLLCVALLLHLRSEGYRIIGLIISIGLILGGIRSLLYYFSMARHMVGGRLELFHGIIALDLGMFAYTLTDIPTIYIVLYLLVAHLFSGVIDVLRALEAKRTGGRWKLNFADGISNILLAFACAFSFRSTTLLVFVYAAGLFYSACLRMAQAFRKTAIAYIP